MSHQISSVFINSSVCGSAEGTVQPALCPVGYYCPPGVILGLEFPCPAGTVQSQLGASSPQACLLCPAGMEKILCFVVHHYNLTQINPLCMSNQCVLNPHHFILLVFPAGMFCSHPGLSEPTGLCEAGFYCPAGSTSPNSTEYQVLFLFIVAFVTC